MKFVFIKPSATEDDYQDAVHQYCKQADHCLLRFWVDTKLIAEKLPMTQQQADGVVASYTKNSSTGRDQFDCKPFGNPGERCAH